MCIYELYSAATMCVYELCSAAAMCVFMNYVALLLLYVCKRTM